MSTEHATADGSPRAAAGCLEGSRRAPFKELLRAELAELEAMLLAKNAAYGNSALEPVRCFSKADTVEQLKVRLDDKLSRLMRGQAAGEDVEADLLGYLVLLRIARRSLPAPRDLAPPSRPPGAGHAAGASEKPRERVKAGSGYCVEWGKPEIRQMTPPYIRA